MVSCWKSKVEALDWLLMIAMYTLSVSRGRLVVEKARLQRWMWLLMIAMYILIVSRKGRLVVEKEILRGAGFIGP